MFKLLTLTVFCLGAATASRADTVVFQTDFQSPGTTPGTYTAGSNVGSPNSFNVFSGSVEVVGGDAGNPCVAAGGAGQCLRLAPVQLYSNTEFGEGRYRVDLEMAGGSSTTQVSAFMGMQFQFITVVANTPFTTYQFFPTISTPNEVSRLQIGGGGGVLLSSVKVTQLGATQTPVPEPATLLLLGTGLVGVAAKSRGRLRRRRTQKSTRGE